MKPQIHYLIGSALDPILLPTLTVHCCNDVGGFGKGFVVPLSEKYPETKKQYKAWFSNLQKRPQLGDVQFVQVNQNVCIANMVAQHDVRWQGKIPPIRYDALEKCLIKSYTKAYNENLTVSGPRFGCVLSGGVWDIISEIIKKVMLVDTYIYTLEKQKNRWHNCYEN
jgi:hypothetical protein